MTKRDARKIAILFAARMLVQNDAPSAGLTVDEADKVQEQEECLGRKLAARYDLDMTDIPIPPSEIVQAVRDGSL